MVRKTLKNKKKNRKKSKKQKGGNNSIILITQFYQPKDSDLLDKLKDTLKRNLNNPDIDKIYLLNEKDYSLSDLGLTQPNKKLNLLNIGTRLKYSDIYQFVNNKKLNGYIVACNSDIFFDDTLKNIRDTNVKNTKLFYNLLRHEYRGEKDLKMCKRFGYTEHSTELDIKYSQDTWICHSNNIKNLIINIDNFKYELGRFFVECHFNYLLNSIGYKIVNDPCKIRTYHNDDRIPSKKIRTLDTLQHKPHFLVKLEKYCY
jgi:hypothetical protein